MSSAEDKKIKKNIWGPKSKQLELSCTPNGNLTWYDHFIKLCKVL